MGLLLKVGDEVTVEFDPVSRKVAYAVANNEGELIRYEQIIGAVYLLSNSVHFCACLNKNDEVSIK
jgi:hypothetical protein